MFRTAAEERDAADVMTLGGTVVRAANLLVRTLASLVFAWIERSWALGFGLLVAVVWFYVEGLLAVLGYRRPAP